MVKKKKNHILESRRLPFNRAHMLNLGDNDFAVLMTLECLNLWTQVAAVVTRFQTAECWELEVPRSPSIALMNGIKKYLESCKCAAAAKLCTAAAETTTQDTQVQQWACRAGLRHGRGAVWLNEGNDRHRLEEMNPAPTRRSNCQKCNIRPAKSTSAVISLYPPNIWGKQSWSGRTSCVRSTCSSPPCLCKKTFRWLEHFPSTIMSWLSKICLIFLCFLSSQEISKVVQLVIQCDWDVASV